MDSVDKLIIDVTMRQNGFGYMNGRNIAEEMEAIANAEKKVIQQSEKTSKSLRKASKSGFALGKAIKTLGAYLGVKQLIKYSDEWTNIEAKLKLITKTDKERVTLQEKLYNISKKTRQSMSGTTDLYQKLTLNTQAMGLNANTRGSLTNLISKALTVGKGTPESNNALLLQFGQALGIGKFAGQDLKSIMQNNSYFASQIAKGLGVNVGDLPKMGAKGELTSQMVLGAILKQATEINKAFEKTPKTLGEAFQVFSDSFGKLLNDFNKATRFSKLLAESIIILSNNIKWVIRFLLPLLIMRSKLLTVALTKSGVAMRYFTMQLNKSKGKAMLFMKSFVKLFALEFLFEQLSKFVNGQDNIFVLVASVFANLEKWLIKQLEAMPEHIKVGLKGVFDGMYDAISNTIGELFAGLIGYFGDLWRTITGQKPHFLDKSNYPHIYKNPSVSNANTSSSNQVINQNFNVTVNEAKQGKAYIDTAFQTMIKQAEVDLAYTPIKTDLGYTPIG